MSTRATINFLALLTLVADAAVLTAALLWVGGRLSPSLAGARTSVAAPVRPLALPFAFAVAATCTLGSLWLSEGAGFPPCKLCWYQRIAMYPLVVLLGLAAVRRDGGVRPYAWALTAVGIPIAAYHYLLERFPSLETGACDPTNPCTVVWIWKFGFVSIPFMAASGFALIAVLVALVPRSNP